MHNGPGIANSLGTNSVNSAGAGVRGGPLGPRSPVLVFVSGVIGYPREDELSSHILSQRQTICSALQRSHPNALEVLNGADLNTAAVTCRR